MKFAVIMIVPIQEFTFSLLLIKACRVHVCVIL